MDSVADRVDEARSMSANRATCAAPAAAEPVASMSRSASPSAPPGPSPGVRSRRRRSPPSPMAPVRPGRGRSTLKVATARPPPIRGPRSSGRSRPSPPELMARATSVACGSGSAASAAPGMRVSSASSSPRTRQHDPLSPASAGGGLAVAVLHPVRSAGSGSNAAQAVPEHRSLAAVPATLTRRNRVGAVDLPPRDRQDLAYPVESARSVPSGPLLLPWIWWQARSPVVGQLARAGRSVFTSIRSPSSTADVLDTGGRLSLAAGSATGPNLGSFRLPR